MPIIDSRKLIFFHIPRCGGTSIERYFNTSGKDQLHGVISKNKARITLHHLTPSEMLTHGYIDRHRFSSYTKFTIIRDPFDRIFSDYCWQRHYDIHNIFTNMNFGAFLNFAEQIVSDRRYYEKVHFDHFRPMIEYCYIDGEPILDHILLLERIDEDTKRCNIVQNESKIPHANSFRKSDLLMEAQQLRERVYSMYSEDHELHRLLAPGGKAAPYLSNS